MLDPAAPKHMLLRLKQWKAHKNTPPKYFEHLCLMEFVLTELIEENTDIKKRYLDTCFALVNLRYEYAELHNSLIKACKQQEDLVQILIERENFYQKQIKLQNKNDSLHP